MSDNSILLDLILLCLLYGQSITADGYANALQFSKSLPFHNTFFIYFTLFFHPSCPSLFYLSRTKTQPNNMRVYMCILPVWSEQTLHPKTLLLHLHHNWSLAIAAAMYCCPSAHYECLFHFLFHPYLQRFCSLSKPLVPAASWKIASRGCESWCSYIQTKKNVEEKMRHHAKTVFFVLCARTRIPREKDSLT